MNPQLPAIVFFTIFFIFWSAGWINNLLLKSYFRKTHPDEANRIIPQSWERNAASNIRFIKYILSRGYSSIPDAEFIKRCDLHQSIFRVCLLVTVVGVLVGLALISIQRHTA